MFDHSDSQYCAGATNLGADRGGSHPMHPLTSMPATNTQHKSAIRHCVGRRASCFQSEAELLPGVVDDGECIQILSTVRRRTESRAASDSVYDHALHSGIAMRIVDCVFFHEPLCCLCIVCRSRRWMEQQPEPVSQLPKIESSKHGEANPSKLYL